MNCSTFAEAINQAGLGFPHIIADGQIHRFRTPEDKGSKKSGWYVCHGDAGAFGDWRTGSKINWRSGRKSDPADRKLLAELAAKEKHKRRAEERARHEKTAIDALALWSQAGPAMWSDYLKQKRVLPLGLRQKNNLLVVPMYDVDGKLWNCQTIRPDGTKRFLKGGRKKGCFYRIGEKPGNKFYIAEGFSTGATVHMHLDAHATVFIAFDAGNLKPVAEALRLRYPAAEIVIAADNDCWKSVNTGLTKARAAAAAVGGSLLYPTWEDVDIGDSKPTDFNDLHRLGGL